MSAAWASERRPQQQVIEAAAERKAKFIWGGLVFAFLGLEIVMCLVAATLATSDASFAVVPSYHEQALQWDESVTAQRVSDALGWTVAIGAGPADIVGQRSVTIALADRTGMPVPSAKLEASFFHHARAGDAQTVAFTETAPGTYMAKLEMRRDGLWEFRVNAVRGDERFINTRQLELSSGGKE